jgi:hypothetical protein
MQTVTLSVRDDYLDKFSALLDALPKNAVKKINTKSLSAEVQKRVDGYKNGALKTMPFDSGLDVMREKLLAKCK